MKTIITLFMFFLMSICYTFAQDSSHLNYVIPDFQVNENSGIMDSEQSHPSIASDSSGNFVIAWLDERDQSRGIYAQYYRTDGEPLGNNFKVNEKDLYGSNPRTAVYTDKSENFLIIWYDYYHIYVQKFSNIFAKIGNNFILNKEEINGYPSTSMDEMGNFIIVWSDLVSQNIFAQRYSSDGIALTSKIKVNDESDRSFFNYEPSVSSNREGDFVITWYTDQNDLHNYTIYAKRYSKSGDIFGDIIKVNNDCTGKSGRPSIASDYHGNFTIVWGNHYQQFSKEGEKIGDNFNFVELNSGVSNMYSYVTARDSGNFVVTWIGWDPDPDKPYFGSHGIYARCYSSSGIALGLPFRVNTDFNLYYNNPAVAINNNGSFVIAWDTEDEFSDNVYAQKYDLDGKNEGDNFRVNDNKESASYNSSIAVDDNGNFVITWLDNRKTYEGNLYDIFIQQYSYDGTTLGDNIKLNRKINEDNEPSIATDSAGNFVITWVENNRIYAQRFAYNGIAIDSCFKVNDTSKYSYYQTTPSIDVADDGSFIIVWSYDNIYIQRFSKDGVRIGNHLKVNENLENELGIKDPNISIDKEGNFIIVWSVGINTTPNDYQDIYAQRYSSNGTPLGNNFKVNEEEIAYYINSFTSIDCDKNGNFVIAWYGDEDIFVQRYSNDGTPLGDNFKVNDTKIADAYGHSISVSMDEIGNFVISWVSTGENYSESKVFEQCYSSDGLPLGNNFIVSTCGYWNSIDVELWNGRIYTTWTAFDENEIGENIYANVIDWNNPTITSVGEKERNEIPTKFELSQNYPNPFNPTTTIKYSIPAMDVGNENFRSVQLKVYDILGREIAVLVNEEQKPGYYEVNWDASNRPSGVYFYRIQAGSYVKTKKMILIK